MITVVVMITMLAIAVAVPVTVFMPAALVPFPPSVILVPAAFTLFVQLTAPTFRLAAALAVFASCLIEFWPRPVRCARGTFPGRQPGRAVFRQRRRVRLRVPSRQPRLRALHGWVKYSRILLYVEQLLGCCQLSGLLLATKVLTKAHTVHRR